MGLLKMRRVISAGMPNRGRAVEEAGGSFCHTSPHGVSPQAPRCTVRREPKGLGQVEQFQETQEEKCWRPNAYVRKRASVFKSTILLSRETPSLFQAKKPWSCRAVFTSIPPSRLRK